MLDRNVDLLLVGHNYFSYLLALSLNYFNKKVLLLDDERMLSGDLYSTHCSLIERHFLETWGIDYEVEPLINIRDYMIKKSVNFIIGKKHIQLGDEPSKNYQELIRKFPFIFKDGEKLYIDPIVDTSKCELFDKLFYSYINELSKKSFRFKSMKSLRLDDFKQNCPEEVWNIYEYLKKGLRATNIPEDQYWNNKTFLYMIKGFFQKRLAVYATDIEIFHLTLCLLSPHYELDNENLLRDLNQVYVNRGGRFKKTYVREWLFDKKKPWSVELASYEGIIHPEKICFLGSLPKLMPLKLKPDKSYYQSYKVRCRYNNRPNNYFVGKRFVYSSVKKIGTHWPLWEAYVGKDELIMHVFVINEKASKLEFYRDRIINIVKTEVPEVLSWDEGIIGELEVEESAEIWIEESLTEKPKKSLIADHEKIDIIEILSPGDEMALKNVNYYGPYKMGTLGIYSSLMDIKDDMHFI